jgi:hypothetical protein
VSAKRELEMGTAVLDDGGAAMLDAATCAAVGARRVIPDPRLLGPGMR